MQSVLSVILGGGRGTRLYPLTQLRSKPAVPIAGKYRLIDIPISNCINSDLNRIYVLTQFLSVSLHRHIANTYKFDPFSRGFVEVLAAQQTNEAADWYQGTADAVFQNFQSIEAEAPEAILMLSGDHIYKMDYGEMVDWHRAHAADITLGTIQVPPSEAGRFGVLEISEDYAVTGFEEKPQHNHPARSRFDSGFAAGGRIDARHYPSPLQSSRHNSAERPAKFQLRPKARTREVSARAMVTSGPIQ